MNIERTIDMIKNVTYLKIGNIIAFAAMVTINILANVIPFGGISTGQLSAMYPTLFTPTGFTFAIWALIYVMLGIFVIGQAFSRTPDDTVSAGPYFILTCVLNVTWIFAWHSQSIVLATLAILGLLALLIKIYSSTRTSGFIARTTFSIYYAWITAASIIALFVLVKTLTGNAPSTPIEPRFAFGEASTYPAQPDLILIGGDPVIATYVTNIEYIAAVLALIIISIITSLHILKFSDYAYAAVIIWAIGGIMYKQLTAPVVPVYLIAAAVFAVCIIAFSTIKHLADQRTIS